MTAYTTEQIAKFETEVAGKSAEEIIVWCSQNIPALFQTTAFGLTGLVTLDILARHNTNTEVVFVDTLHHFKETHELIEAIRQKYPNIKLHIYFPEDASTPEEFTEKFGEKLWETNDLLYDYLVKVEPVERAYKDLKIGAVFTGRRRSQGDARTTLPIFELTENGLLKINPLAGWSFEEVKKYIDEHNVPYNALLDRGYRSVGDWHSTEPVKEGEDERAGRWRGKQKTECGIHDTKRFEELRATPAN